MATWMLRLIHHDPKAGGDLPSLEDVTGWLGHGFQRQAPPEAPATVEELHAKMELLSQFYSNGQQAEG